MPKNKHSFMFDLLITVCFLLSVWQQPLQLISVWTAGQWSRRVWTGTVLIKPLHLLKQAGCSAGRVCLSLRCSDGVSSACGGGWSCEVPDKSFRVSLCRRLLKQDELSVCGRTALSHQNYILLLYFQFFRVKFQVQILRTGFAMV